MNQLDECMYCGFDKDLTDEHIIPFGMGGDLILKKSSCKECAKKTSRDEMKVLRGFMYDGRLVGGMPSRRRKKQPTRITNILLRKDGTVFSKEFLLRNAIAAIHLPIFTAPGVIFGKEVQEGIKIRELGTLNLGLENLENLYKTESINGVRLNAKIDTTSFCKVLCKIAYGYHVQKKGLFPREESPALSIMLGKNTHFQHWIGSRDTAYPGATGLHILETEELHLKNGYIIHLVYITLFHGMGCNSAYAVVTRISKQ